MIRKKSNGNRNSSPAAIHGQDPFRSLFDHSADALLIIEKATGRCLDANAAAQALSGRSLSALQTMPLADVLRMAENRTFESVCASSIPMELGDVVFLRSDGSERIARLNILPMNDTAVFAMVCDITEQKRAEQGLRESERKMRSIFRAAPTGIGVVQNRILREVNARFCEICGYSREELVGNCSRMLYPTDEDYEYVGREKYRQIAKQGIGSVETRLRRKDGTIIHVLMNSSPLEEPFSPSVGVSFTVLDITDWKRAGEKLRQSEEKYKIIANFTYDWEFWLKPDNRLAFISPACERITGYSPQTFHEDPSLLWSIVHPDDQQLVNAHLASGNQTATGNCSLDFRIINAQGQIKWINHYCLPVFADDGTFMGRRARNQDISERKHHEEMLKASEQRFHELFDNMGAAVVICDSPDRGNAFILKDLNQSSLNYIKRDKKSVVGRDVRDVFPGVQALGLFDVFTRVWASGLPERHPASHYKDARIDAWLESYVCKLSSGELVAICEDITIKHQSREAQARMEKQIQEAQKLESIGVLAGGIAHDFNNILFPISGMAELLMEDLPEGSPEHESAIEIYQAAKRAGDLVRQILSFSRRAEHKKIPTRIQQMLKEIVKLVRSTIPSNIEIVYDIQNNCAPVMADPTQLHQIAMNLITNAYHAIETTGGRITVSLKEVLLQADAKAKPCLPSGRYARFSVTDTGCGIDPAILDKIFEPYFTTKTQGKGTGLGLSVVYGIVKEHHGDIRVDSSPGKGTTMDLFFPVLDCETTDEVEAVEPVDGTGDERIMVVDDEAQVALMEKRMLERFGYQVASFTSSLAALNAFRQLPETFDLVVTDITMPNMTGDYLAKKLIAIRPDLPIIACTGFSERIDHEQLTTIGIRRVLMKPINRSEMIRAVRQVLDEVGYVSA